VQANVQRFIPQSLEAIKLRKESIRCDGGIKRVGLNRGAARNFRLWGFKGTATARSAASRQRSMEMLVEIKAGADRFLVMETVQRDFGVTSWPSQTHPCEDGRLRVKRA